jgi:aspartyl-tRNA(Asn)/glutamyl-tRNA(Gln) amidotransferase subunit A
VFAKNVDDSQIVFDIIAGKDELDATSIRNFKSKNLEVKSEMIIGVPELDMTGIDERVVANFNEQISKAEKLGYKIKKIKLPNIKYSIPTYYIILPAEASSNLARYDGIRYGARVEGDNLLAEYIHSKGQGFGKEPRRRIILGTYVLSAGYYDAYYGTAMRVRELIKQDFDQAFRDVDAIIMPTTPGPAFKIGTKSLRSPLEMYLEDIFTAPANIAGICGISVPSGEINEEGNDLPLGLQILGNRGCEDIVFSIGKKFMGE